jgi:hypothetical protein
MTLRNDTNGKTIAGDSMLNRGGGCFIPPFKHALTMVLINHGALRADSRISAKVS